MLERAECASVIRSTVSLSLARGIHSRLARTGRADTYLWNLLIEMYGRLGCVDYARSVFEGLQARNVYSWTMMLTAFAENGHLLEAEAVFDNMPEKNVVSWTSMVLAYARNGRCELAKLVFDAMPERNVISWNTLLAGYAENGYHKELISTLSFMDNEGFKPDSVTFLAVLEACSESGDLTRCVQVHARVVMTGLLLQTKLGNALVTSYGRLREINRAKLVFDSMGERNTVSWNTMIVSYAGVGLVGHARSLFDETPDKDLTSYNNLISAYTRNGHAKEGYEIFLLLLLDGQVKPDDVTFLSVLATDSNSLKLAEVENLHKLAVETGQSADWRIANALVNNYGKCGAVQEASALFEDESFLSTRLPTSCWNVMLGAYVQNNLGPKAISLFHKMDLEGIKPDSITMVLITDACESTSERVSIYARALSTGFHNLKVATALVTMLGNHGMVEAALEMFESIPQKTPVLWTSVIVAFARNGFIQRTLELFQSMALEGMEPDQVVFISVLTACSHAGLIRESWRYLSEMLQEYGVTPSDQHLLCMIDVLGRAGLLDEAETAANKLAPNSNSNSNSNSLLSACRVQGDKPRSERLASAALDQESHHPPHYLLLSSVCQP